MDITAVAKLANLTLTAPEIELFSSQLPETLDHIAVINQLDTADVQPTSQVTGLTNISRPDVIDFSRLLPPPKNNYYIVPAIF